jgi:RNA polymerase sigma-70 factor (ECF subfamily)
MSKTLIRAGEDLAATVRAAQGGDTMALDALVEELMPYMGRICGAIALERGEDALQDALVALLRRLDHLREPAAVRAWARTIAVREAVRLARSPRQATDPELLARVPAEGGDPALGVELRDQLDRLDPQQRAVLVLRTLEGLSEEEVAALLELPRGTVKSRLHRARERFRRGWSG